MTTAERIFSERFPTLYATKAVQFPGDGPASPPRGKLEFFRTGIGNATIQGPAGEPITTTGPQKYRPVVLAAEPVKLPSLQMQRTTTLTRQECKERGLCMVCGTPGKLRVPYNRPEGKVGNYCVEHSAIWAAYQRAYSAQFARPSRAKE